MASWKAPGILFVSKKKAGRNCASCSCYFLLKNEKFPETHQETYAILTLKKAMEISI